MSLLGSNQTTTPLLHSLKVTQAIAGICIPIVYGKNRVPQNLVWYGDFTSGAPYQEGGKGLGKNGTDYEYYAAVLGALCQGTVSGIGNIWSSNGRLTLNSVTEIYTVPPTGGTYTVTNADRYVFDAGVGANVNYSVPANNYGAPGPTTITGIQTIPQSKTTGTPGAGEYAIPTPGAYVFPAASAGIPMQITYNYSLYTLAVTQDDTIPLTGPYEITVDNATEFSADLGVIYIFTGQPLTKVAASPASGQYSTDGAGNYFFASADGGLSVAISYSFIQSQSNIDPGSTLNFTLLEGTAAQAAWAYLVSNHPSQAFGYSTIALVGTPSMDLGEAAQLPNYNYEVLAAFQFGAGIVDADVASCIFDLLTNPFYGAQFEGGIDDSLITVARDYWDSNGFFISPVLDSSRPCAEIIEEWCEAGNVGIYWSEGLLKFIPYGDTTTVGNGYVYQPQTAPVVDLTDDDFISDGNDDPVQIERTPWQDAYNQVKIQFSNRANDYNPDVVTEQDDYATELFGLRPEGQKNYSFLCNATSATFTANIRLKRLVYIRKKYSFKISGLRYCFLEPMDLVTLTDVMLGLNKEPCRILSIEEDDDRNYSIVAEEFPWGTQTATLYPKQPSQPPPPPPALADPGNTEVIAIFEPTSRVAVAVANSAFQIWMALTGGQNWLGCNVWLSVDGVSYSPIGTQNGTSRAGVTTDDLPAAADPDTTDVLGVSTTGELYDVSVAQADAFATLSLLGMTEYISYANANLTGSSGNGLINDYNLSYLRRGVFSSPDIDHPTGTQFIRCDNQLFQYSFDPSLVGKTIFFKFTSFNLLQNQVQSLANVPAYPFTVTGINTSQNMIVDSVVTGTTATVRIYQVGQAVGTAGSAILGNGALVNLPAESYTGEAQNTTYYANYDLTTSAYVLYTDHNQWLKDQATGNFIAIGQTLTGLPASAFTTIPLSGGGTLVIGAGSSTHGTAIALPPGYTVANSLIWASMRDANASTSFARGMQTTIPSMSLVPQSEFLLYGGGSSGLGDTNWIAVAWSAGAAVTVTTGVTKYLTFTTANGDELCFEFGTVTGGRLVPSPPSGFSRANSIAIAGINGTAPTSPQPMRAVFACSIDSSGNVVASYISSSMVQWGGTADIFTVFYQPGGGVTDPVVTNGVAIVIPLVGGHSLALIAAPNIPSGDSFGVPPAFSGASVASAAAMSGQVTGGGSSCKSLTVSVSGYTLTATYTDGGSTSWSGKANIFAITSI